MPQVLSPDLQAQFPRLELKTKPTRTHTETYAHPIFRWMKQEVEVIDALEFVEIIVTQLGRSWTIPLTMLREDEEEVDDE